MLALSTKISVTIHAMQGEAALGHVHTALYLCSFHNEWCAVFVWGCWPRVELLHACRYGDEQHLEEALERIFMIGRPKGLPRRQCPRLTGLREEVVEGNYALIMEFANRNNMTKEQWDERQEKFGTFFGPGVTALVRFSSFS